MLCVPMIAVYVILRRDSVEMAVTLVYSCKAIVVVVLFVFYLVGWFMPA